MPSAALEKYLQLYAEPQIGDIPALPSSAQWSNVLVVPAHNEQGDFLAELPHCMGRSLLVLVINQTQSATAAVSATNQALHQQIQAQYSCVNPGADHGPITLLNDPDNDRDILLVDCYSEGNALQPGSGVGHARKIGGDIAARLFADGHLSTPWIHCSDADVSWPKTYFQASQPFDSDTNLSALIYPFRHCQPGQQPEDLTVHAATLLYEFSLYYYVAGLASAGSPYAFQTIGSTLAIHAEHYARVRGFPKREAGEDFYLLNKLAKTGRVLQLEESSQCQPIRIRSRESDRVPFGTGKAVSGLMQLDDARAEYKFYHPRIFTLLRQWLALWPQLYARGSTEIDEYFLSETNLSENDRSLLAQALNQIQVRKGLKHALGNSKDESQFMQQMHHWFDAFRTLKLLHTLRDAGYPSITLQSLSCSAEFSPLLKSDPLLKRAYLALDAAHPR